VQAPEGRLRGAERRGNVEREVELLQAQVSATGGW